MLNKLKISQKLLFGFGIVALIAAIVGTTGFTGVSKLGSNIYEIGEVRMPSIDGLAQIRLGMANIWVAELGLINRRMMDSDVRKAQYEWIEENYKRIDEGWKKYEPLPQTDEEAKIWKEFVSVFENWKNENHNLVRISKEKDNLIARGYSKDSPEVAKLDDDALASSLKSRELLLSASEHLTEINRINREIGEKEVARSETIAARSKTVSLVATIIGVLLAVFLGMVISRAITRPLKEMVEVAENVSLGDVNQNITYQSNDELGELANSFRSTVEYIQGVANAAQQLGKGDLSAQINARSDKDILSQNMSNVVNVLQNLVAEANMLSKAAIEGRLNTRGNASNFEGGYKQIVEGVNNTLDSVVGHLDNIPAPVMIIDNDFNIQYINNFGAEVGGKTPQQLVGTKCYDHFKTSDCKTANCACAKVMSSNTKAESETDAHPGNLDLEISYVGVPIKDESGKVVGALEVVQDQTAIKQAARLQKKIADFQEVEVAKLNEGLAKLSAGNLDFVIEVEEADNDTREVKEKFETIANAVNNCVAAINRLSEDANMLVASTLEGKLQTRADATKHSGDFAKIVDGINATLDAVVEPINEAAEVLDHLANNDLTARMQGDYKGDFALIKESLNKAMDTLQSAILQVAESSTKVAASSQTLSAITEEVSKGSQQIAETSNQVAQGSQDQARTVEASSAAMEQLGRAIQEVSKGAQSQATTVDETVTLVQQISAAIDQVASSAQDAARTSHEVSEVADSGGKQVADAVGSMSKIKEATDAVADMVRQLGDQSQQIGAIVETIDDIAEQTNLLALNAAIEAARAGEHGKGFAVVADEVRKLAERSSKATGEIAELIQNIQQMTEQAVSAMERGSHEVEEGTALGNEAGEALQKIQTAIRGVVKQVEEVSAAAQQMTASSNEVIKAIENVSAITEESTAATEEMAASSTEVGQQIEQVAAVSEENAAAAREVSDIIQEQNASIEE
ncbi:MAG: methyl-accepting chemotaxis protein, partial [Armatimonadota bacterium]